MFKNLEEVRSLIAWAKTQKIRRLKLGELEVDISELAYVDDLTTNIPTVESIEPKSAAEQAKEDEKLLYWSSNG